MPHKAGFVNILGLPNTGKSSLMNALLGEKLSIVTHKAQTTRQRVNGIVNTDDYQIVFSDTPGYLDKPGYKLHHALLSYIDTALNDADIIILLIDMRPFEQNLELIEKVKSRNIPTIVLLNKMDQADQLKVAGRLKRLETELPDSYILPISALHSFNLEQVFEKVVELLPKSPPFFPKDELSDRTVRFFVSEMIREKVFLQFQDELPYSIEVAVEDYKEEEKIDHIRVNIFVLRESQKAIILGHHGKAIKRLGTDSRKEIESFVGKKVFLELTVKVSADWRDNNRMLRKFGYE